MRIAVLTGASGGLGREFASHIRKTYPDIECIYLIARRAEGLTELARKLGGNVRVVPLDLCGGFEAEYSAMLAAEKPDVRLLINNAGCGYLQNFDSADPGELRRTTTLNVTALTLVTRLTLPYMARGSAVINVSSIASFAPNARMATYSASKAYVSALSRALGEELRPRGITVTAVCPGPMPTDFLSVGRINGNSRMFEQLPACDPSAVAAGALRAARAGRAVYTPRLFFKAYRVAAKLMPHALLVRLVKT